MCRSFDTLHIDRDQCQPSLHDDIDACQYPLVNPLDTLAVVVLAPSRRAASRGRAQRLAPRCACSQTPLDSVSSASSRGSRRRCLRLHLTEPLGLSQPTVWRRLKVLLEAGLVERKHLGSWAYFRVLPERLETLRSLLA